MPRETLTPAAQWIIRDLVTLRGMSYVEAVAYCEQRAKEAAAPYLEVAGRLRDELAKTEEPDHAA